MIYHMHRDHEGRWVDQENTACTYGEIGHWEPRLDADGEQLLVDNLPAYDWAVDKPSTCGCEKFLGQVQP